MTQLLQAKRLGWIEVDKTFVLGTRGIWKLTRGGYLHRGGAVITRKADLDIINDPGELQAAYDWYDHRNEKPKEAPPKRILIKPEDGSFEFEDGSPITDFSEIVKALPQGPIQTIAMQWLSDKKKKDELTHRKLAHSKVSIDEKLDALKNDARIIKGKRVKTPEEVAAEAEEPEATEIS